MLAKLGVPVLSLCLLLPLAGQQQPTISVRVDEVQVVATVRDEKGRIRTDLVKEDFILEEEGKPVDLDYFSSKADLPLTLGLLIDTSMSQVRVLPEEKRASLQFLQQVMRPKEDLAFLISFDIDTELLQNLTNDLKAFQRAIQEARHPGTQNRPQFGTVLYDAVFLAADEVLKDQAGRKAIIMASDGADHGSIVNLESALEKAQRADTVIYSIYYSSRDGNRSVGVGGGRGGLPRIILNPVNGKKALKKLSDETGGHLYEISNKLPLNEIFRQIQEELRSQYIFVFTPPKGFASKAFRKISLRTRDKKLKVFCRSGYYPRGGTKDALQAGWDHQ
jgi:VWFA-related protein